MQTRIFPAVAALGLVLVTLLEWRQSRATLRDHHEACTRFAHAHGRSVVGLCTNDAVPRVLPRYAKARDTLAKEGIAAIPRVLDEAEALDREPSFLGSLVATALFEQSLALLEAPENAALRPSLLAKRRLRSNAEVLEAWDLAMQTSRDAIPLKERLQAEVAELLVVGWLPPTAKVHGLPAEMVREKLALRTKAAAHLAAMRG